MKILQRIWLQICTLQDWSWNLKVHITWKDLSAKINQFTWKSQLCSQRTYLYLSQVVKLIRDSVFICIYLIIQGTELFLYRIQMRIILYDNDEDYTSSWFFLWSVLKLSEWRLDHTGVCSFYRWRTFTAIKIWKQGPLRMLMSWKRHLYIPFNLPCGMSIYCHALHCN
jgi:hypothetical protein